MSAINYHAMRPASTRSACALPGLQTALVPAALSAGVLNTGGFAPYIDVSTNNERR
jgi:hypothetical protein